MKELNEYREKIDSLDKQIIKLLSERFEVVKQVWKYKKKNDMKPLQSWRWQEVLDSRKALAKELWVKEDLIEIIWNNMHDYALELESDILW